MTQFFDGDGNLVAVTVIEAGPCPSRRCARSTTDGYDAVQLAFEDCKDKQLTKPELGHLKKAGVKHGKRHLVEFRGLARPQGRRHGHRRGLRRGRQGQCHRRLERQGLPGHGQAAPLRPRSGVARLAQHPPAGFDRRQRLPEPRVQGHAHERSHGRPSRSPSRACEIVRRDPENNLLLVRGAVPGAKNSVVVVKGR